MVRFFMSFKSQFVKLKCSTVLGNVLVCEGALGISIIFALLTVFLY